MQKIKQIISEMSLEQKAKLCAGADTWHTVGIDHPEIPAIMMSDGPHGLRKQEKEQDNLGIHKSIEAVCFPAACASACSFNTELIKKMGHTVAEECHAVDVDIILGPGINIKRSPLCGRNFEYFSEDPVVAAEMGGAFIEGCQNNGIGTSLKHFAMNNQEFRRLSCSSETDERTFRELYLYAFEQIVKKQKPWTVMCSYNMINGIYSAENKRLLTDILRDEWGFDGFVVSDWGAVSERVDGICAGMDLEMPYGGVMSENQIIAAVKDGSLEESELNKCVENILNIVFRCVDNRRKAVYDLDGDHKIAKEIADECLVLLKNDDDVLPLKSEEKVALIGAFAEQPRYQGGGSSHVNAFKVTKVTDLVAEYNTTYCKGFSIDSEDTDEVLLNEAIQTAQSADKVVIFAGLPESFETESMDRSNMKMPKNQNQLIAEVAKVNSNTVVVLQNGSTIEMPWIGEVKGVMEAYLGGQAISESIVDTLFGKVNPSGKLAESFPLRLEDNPSYIEFSGKHGKTYYREGVFVGYRYYDKRNMDVLFPFGHGLSYTEFTYSDLKLSTDSVRDTDTLEVSVTVTNTGKMAGKEAVQLYVADRTDSQIRPIRELKAFKKVSLAPGESQTVTFVLDKRAFAWYSEELADFYAATGDYDIEIGRSSRDIVLTQTVHLTSTVEFPFVVTKNTSLEDLTKHPRTAARGKELMEEYIRVHYAGKVITNTKMQSTLNAPLRNFARNVRLTAEQFENLLKELNA